MMRTWDGNRCVHSYRRRSTVLFTTLLLVLPMAAWRPPPPRETSDSQTTDRRLVDRVFALCIGVGKGYAGDAMGTEYADSDASEVARVFSERFGYDATTLINRQATRAGILKSLGNINQAVGSNDAIIIYFAGHGETWTPPGNAEKYQRTAYIIPADAAPQAFDSSLPPGQRKKQLEETALDMREFAELARNNQAKHVLLFMDCCYSGAIGAISFRSGIDPDQSKLDKAVVQGLLRERTQQVLTAGKANETTYGVDGHGVFTAALLEVLDTTSDDLVPVVDLFAHVRTKVQQVSITQRNMELTPQSHPFIYSEGDWVFIDRHRPDYDELLTDHGQAAPVEGPTRSVVTEESEYREVAAEARKTSNDGSLESEPKWVKRRQTYEERASRGDPYAMAILHEMYAAGIGVKRDQNKAFEWAMDAHDTGAPVGKATIANSYEHGIGVDRDEQVADQMREALKGFETLLSITKRDRGQSSKTDIIQQVLSIGDVIGSLIGTSGDSPEVTSIDQMIAAIVSGHGSLNAAIASNDADAIRTSVQTWQRSITALRDALSDQIKRRASATSSEELDIVEQFASQLQTSVREIRRWQRSGLRKRMQDEVDNAGGLVDQLRPFVR